MKLYVNDLDIHDFDNTFDEQTEFGNRREVIDQLKEEQEKQEPVIPFNYKEDFRVEMLEDINYPIHKMSRR